MNTDKTKNSVSPMGVSALFLKPEQAEAAYRGLIERGITQQRISVVMSDYAHKSYFDTKPSSISENTHALGDAGRGALLGGATGGIATAIAAVATNLVLPGIGLVFIGPLLAGVAGAAGGALAGGAIGAMIGSGFQKDEAETYESGLREGNLLVSAEADTRGEIDVIKEVLGQNKGHNIYVRYSDEAGDHV
jgi:hypothetical protein